MTRSFGDTCGHAAGIVAEPEIKEFDIKEEDRFLILGSDGLFDFLSNIDLVRYVAPFYEKM